MTERRAPGAGRKRKPTELKRLQGTLKKSRENKREPRIPPARPLPMYGLDKMERRHFDSWVDHLLLHNVVTVVDGSALSSLVIAECRMIRAKKAAQLPGGTVDSDGKLTAWARELHQSQVLHKALCTEFGMTPSSRSRVNSTMPPAKGKSDEDEAAERFFGAT